MNIRNLLSQWCHNTNVKDNLTAIVLEKKLENVGRVCETNTGHCLDTAEGHSFKSFRTNNKY